MSHSTQTNTDDTIDLKELFFTLIHQWKIIALCAVLSLICAILYIRATPDVYSVNALVQVNDSKGGAASALLGKELSSIVDGAGLGGIQPAQAEVEILKSRLILGQAIQQLHLDTEITSTENNIFQRIVAPVSFKTQYTPQAITVYSGRHSLVIRQFQVPETFLDQPLRLEIEGTQFSLIHLKNKETVLQGTLNQPKIQGGWKVAVFAQPQSEKIAINIRKNSLISAVKRFLENYSASEQGKQTGIIGLSYQGTDNDEITKILNTILNIYYQQNIAQNSAQKAQTIQFLEKRLPVLRQDLDQAERQFNQFREQHNTVDIQQESELYLKQSIELETQKIQLQQKQAELAAQYTNEHPMMQEINAQLAALENKLNELNKTIKQLPNLQRLYLQYYRDVQVKTELYTNLLNTYQTLSIAKAGEIGNVRIVDYAVKADKPIKPKKAIILILSLLVGGFIGVLIALIRMLLRSGIRDSKEVEITLGLPIYGTIPHSEYQPSRIHKRAYVPLLAASHGDDIAIESLRSARTTIAFALAKAKNNIILVTSPAPGAGKSFISANLATLLAQTNKRVIVIDADLRRGYLHKYFNYNNAQGITDILTGKIALEQALQTTIQPELSFLARGEYLDNPAELLHSQAFEQLMEQLKTQFDYVIIDSPPTLAVTDSLLLAKFSGVNLLVARFARTPLKELEMVVDRFRHSGYQFDGVLINGVEMQGQGYGYGYNYAYHYSNKEKK